MNITIKDVAKEANVSTSTVSRVLSNSTSISEETKQRVRKAVDKLNYKPNLLARSLVSKKNKMIGVVVPNDGNEIMSNNFFVSLMKGISLCAQKKGYYVSYSFSEDEDDSKAIREMYKSGLVDGICILRSKEEDQIVKELNKSNFPFVLIGRCNETENALWVDNDNFKISFDVVQEMIEKGKKNILFLGAKEEWNVSKDRLKGYKMAFEMNSIPLKKELIIQGCSYSKKVGYNMIKKIYNLGIEIDSIFAADDLLAIGALEYLDEINEQIDIIGFNNIPLCEYQKRKLSTVDINSDQLGYSAAELLIEELNGELINNKHRIVKCNIIKRETFI